MKILLIKLLAIAMMMGSTTSSIAGEHHCVYEKEGCKNYPKYTITFEDDTVVETDCAIFKGHTIAYTTDAGVTVDFAPMKYEVTTTNTPSTCLRDLNYFINYSAEQVEITGKTLFNVSFDKVVTPIDRNSTIIRKNFIITEDMVSALKCLWANRAEHSTNDDILNAAYDLYPNTDRARLERAYDRAISPILMKLRKDTEISKAIVEELMSHTEYNIPEYKKNPVNAPLPPVIKDYINYYIQEANNVSTLFRNWNYNSAAKQVDKKVNELLSIYDNVDPAKARRYADIQKEKYILREMPRGFNRFYYSKQFYLQVKELNRLEKLYK